MRWKAGPRLVAVLGLQKKPWRWRLIANGQHWAIVLIRDGEGESAARRPGE